MIFLVHSKVHWSHADMPLRLAQGMLAQGKPARGRLAMLLWALLLFMWVKWQIIYLMS